MYVESRGHFQELILSFYHVSPRGQTQALAASGFTIEPPHLLRI